MFAGLGAALAALVLPEAAPGEDLDAARRRMLAEIDQDVRETATSTGVTRLSPAVRHAIETVPRERFVPPLLASRAYDNRPLPIGHDQTISQPFIVALMTELLEPRASDRVLEIGTGSGYQAAVLAACVRTVYSIEIVAPLAQQARAALDAAGVRNVETRIGDGYRGWPEAAPFDGIIVTAAPDHVPPALLEQLAPGGRMVIPVGAGPMDQELLLIQRDADGRTVTRRTIGVRFVPLTRER
ncbi:MAG TPA: protein-L-isoaspartate(D-aspartate) O-methyltransferase [Burkholderiaceae bacterium]|nr:protein-L-isoaspartate(D-aspartate) O-methyltransferase [Burkholderiaceae bacterium]